MGFHVITSALHTDHFEQDEGDLWTVISGAGDYLVVTAASANATVNNASYFVETSANAVTLVAGSSLDHLTVFDSHFNFGANNCTVNLPGGFARVMNVDGEIMVFFKDTPTTWRFVSIGIGSSGVVTSAA